MRFTRDEIVLISPPTLKTEFRNAIANMFFLSFDNGNLTLFPIQARGVIVYGSDQEVRTLLMPIL